MRGLVSALILCSLASFGAQVSPEADPEKVHEERAVLVLQGKPAITVRGYALVLGANGATMNRITNTFAREAVELVLRRNGIPVVESCEGGATNCGKLNAEIDANCSKTELLAANDRLCVAEIKFQFLENSYSARPAGGSSADLNYRGFCVVWEEPFVPMLTTDKLLPDEARRRWEESADKFSLYYLRANPAR